MRYLPVFLFFFFVPFCFPFSSHADSALLRGTARIILAHPEGHFSFDQAVVIKDDGAALFETLDDFGNTLLRLDSSEGVLRLLEGPVGAKKAVSHRRFKKLLSLPLSEREFVAFLLYRIPHNRDDFILKKNADGEVLSAEKKSEKAKNNYRVLFKEFTLINGLKFPRVVEIAGLKSTLRLTWIDLELEP